MHNFVLLMPKLLSIQVRYTHILSLSSYGLRELLSILVRYTHILSLSSYGLRELLSILVRYTHIPSLSSYGLRELLSILVRYTHKLSLSSYRLRELATYRKNTNVMAERCAHDGEYTEHTNCQECKYHFNKFLSASAWSSLYCSDNPCSKHCLMTSLLV